MSPSRWNDIQWKLQNDRRSVLRRTLPDNLGFKRSTSETWVRGRPGCMRCEWSGGITKLKTDPPNSQNKYCTSRSALLRQGFFHSSQSFLLQGVPQCCHLGRTHWELCVRPRCRTHGELFLFQNLWNWYNESDYVVIKVAIDLLPMFLRKIQLTYAFRNPFWFIPPFHADEVDGNTRHHYGNAHQTILGRVENRE